MPSESLDELGRLLRAAEVNGTIARNNSNFARATYGTIKEIEDPEERGRVKLVLDETNPEYHTEQGYENQGEPTLTDWMEPKVPFVGLQPEALIGSRVPVEPKQGDPNRLFFGDPVADLDETKEAKQPKNSAMTRLPVYPAGSLPKASEENVGCMVVEQDGRMESDWLCVCLKRSGDYYWVRHIDMAHGHAGENDGKQPTDSGGDFERPVEEQSIWDYVFPTTGGEMQKYSAYGTKPRANPYGEKAKWYEPPTSGETDDGTDPTDDFDPSVTRPPNLPGF